MLVPLSIHTVRNSTICTKHCKVGTKHYFSLYYTVLAQLLHSHLKSVSNVDALKTRTLGRPE